MENDSLTFVNQVIHELLGDKLTGVVLLVAYIFAFCGMFLRWFFTYQVNGRPDPNTPKDFSLKYWIKDNLVYKLAGVSATVIILFITIRFPQEIMGSSFSYFYAFSIGIGFDYVISLIKKLKK